MKTYPNTAFFFMVALVLVFFLTSYTKPFGQEEVSLLRARQIELVDEAGKVRASLKIEEGGETVFRIMDETGTIRVKIGGSKDGSGLVLLDDATNPGIHALAKTTGTTLSLVGKDGKKKQIEP